MLIRTLSVGSKTYKKHRIRIRTKSTGSESAQYKKDLIRIQTISAGSESEPDPSHTNSTGSESEPNKKHRIRAIQKASDLSHTKITGPKP